MLEIWQQLQLLIGAVLVFFYNLIPSYGVAIILLTIAVGLLLFPLTLKQTRSMRAMSEMSPEVNRLRKEFKGDRDRLNQELSALYRDRGVNPAAGCLPLVLQAPIWFALFRVLQNPDRFISETSALFSAIQSNARFLGMDLKVTPSQVFAQQGILPLLPYLVLILIVVGSGYYQQKQAMSSSKPDQQLSDQARQMQTVTKFMPLMFGFFSWGFPTGLVLYFAASNIFRIGQQALMFRLEPPSGKAETKEEATVEVEGTANKPPQRKRKKRKRK